MSSGILPWKTPVESQTLAKYTSGQGLFSGGNLPLGTPQSWKTESVRALNASVTRKTWSQYQVPINHIKAANEQFGLGLSLPMSEEDTIKFCQYMLFEDNKDLGKKKVEPSTVRNYLSGLRQAHLAAGLDAPKLVTPLVGLMLRGQENVLKESRDRN